MDDPELDATGSWMKGVNIYGLPGSTNCRDRNGLSIDNGRINPPTDGPAAEKSATNQYDIWCAEANSPLDELGVKDGKGCREMRYPKFYSSVCPHPGFP